MGCLAVRIAVNQTRSGESLAMVGRRRVAVRGLVDDRAPGVGVASSCEVVRRSQYRRSALDRVPRPAREGGKR